MSDYKIIDGMKMYAPDTTPKPTLDEREFREFWIGWPDGETPEIIKDVFAIGGKGCVKFIEKAAIAEMQAEIDKLKSQVETFKGFGDYRLDEYKKKVDIWKGLSDLQGERLHFLDEKIEALEAENQKLREALEGLLELCERGPDLSQSGFLKEVDIARKALEGEGLS